MPFKEKDKFVLAVFVCAAVVCSSSLTVHPVFAAACTEGALQDKAVTLTAGLEKQDCTTMPTAALKASCEKSNAQIDTTATQTSNGTVKQICKGGVWTNIVPPAAAAAPTASPRQVQLPDPLNGANLLQVLGNVIRVFLGTVGAISLAVFVYAGLMYLFSAGSSDMVSKAKETMKYGAIGLLVIMGAYLLTTVFVNIFS